MPAYNQSKRQLWRSIAAAAGATGLYNNTERELIGKLAILSGVPRAVANQLGVRPLLFKSAQAAGCAGIYNNTTRQLLLKLAAVAGLDLTCCNEIPVRLLLYRLIGSVQSGSFLSQDDGSYILLDDDGKIQVDVDFDIRPSIVTNGSTLLEQ